MMDPITIAMGLANVAPGVLKWLGNERAAESAQKVVDIAQQVTGTGSAEAALMAIQSSPSLATQLQQALDQQADVLAQYTPAMTSGPTQASMFDGAGLDALAQLEARVESWPTYGWRPFIGFAFGLLGIVSGLTVAMCYIGVVFFNANATVLGTLPQMIGSEAAIMATMAPVLGIASWFRGKMQADPTIRPARKV